MFSPFSFVFSGLTGGYSFPVVRRQPARVRTEPACPGGFGNIEILTLLTSPQFLNVAPIGKQEFNQAETDPGPQKLAEKV